MSRLWLPLLLLCVVACAACGSLPKVEAWQKGDLARPSMALDPDPVEGMLAQHTYQSKEAASGGFGVGGGGCGCN